MARTAARALDRQAGTPLHAQVAEGLAADISQQRASEWRCRFTMKETLT